MHVYIAGGRSRSSSVHRSGERSTAAEPDEQMHGKVQSRRSCWHFYASHWAIFGQAVKLTGSNTVQRGEGTARRPSKGSVETLHRRCLESRAGAPESIEN